MTTEKMLGMAGAILGAVAVIGLILVATVWQPTSKAAPATGTQTIDIRMGEGEVIEEIGGVETLTGEFHRWEPDVIVVHKGDTVVLNVSNPRSMSHSFVLPAFGVDTGELAARTGTATAQFVADEAGTFQYKCGVTPDEAAGKCDPDHNRQVGYLIVLDQ